MRVNEPLTEDNFRHIFAMSTHGLGQSAEKARVPDESCARVTKEQPSCAIFALSRGEQASGGEFRLVIFVWSA